MGLFDNYFDPQTYQGGGGFLDRLLAQLQPQYQPPQGPGFAPGNDQPSPLDTAQWPAGPGGGGRTFDNATFNPATYAPAQAMNANASVVPNQNHGANDPIAVGNYQMPRIGSGFQQDVEPEEKVLPKQTGAEQAAGQLPAQFLQRQNSPGGFGSAMRGAVANMQGGPLGMIGGAISGAMGMGQGTALEQQQRTMQQTYAALIAAGVPPQKAQLAAINPEYGKTIVSEALSNKQKYAKIGQDGLGREQYGFVDETNQTVNGKPLSAQPQDAGGGGLGNMDLSGKAYLATVPAAQRGIVQGIVEGTIAPPSSFALGKPYWQNILQAAKNYDPTFDATNWSGRVAGVKDFSAGKSSEMVRSANQTLHHAGQLLKSMDDLNNGDYPLINRVGNAANEATGGGAPTAFRLNAHAVAEEMSKVFKGANLSDAEIRSWEQNLHENMSPEQQRAAVGKLKDLLQGSLQALDEKRVASMGQMAADKAGPIIKPEGVRVLKQIDEWLAKGGATNASKPAQTKTGVSWSVVQ